MRDGSDTQWQCECSVYSELFFTIAKIQDITKLAPRAQRPQQTTHALARHRFKAQTNNEALNVDSTAVNQADHAPALLSAITEQR